MIRARQREERAWALHCATATAVAGTEEGQAYLQTLWGQLQPAASTPRDPAADEAEIERVQAQARLDGLVRQVKVSRDE